MVTTTKNQMRNCPFCGDEDIRLEKNYPDNCVGHFWKIYCKECGGGFEYEHNEKEALAAWNNRPKETDYE